MTEPDKERPDIDFGKTGNNQGRKRVNSDWNIGKADPMIELETRLYSFVLQPSETKDNQIFRRRVA